MEGVLNGIRVVEWSLVQQAPVAGAMLGDMGADVIKVEPPTSDPCRGLTPVLGTDQLLPHGRHTLFEVCNRNKRGIALDLKNPKAREIAYQLVNKADVFLTNYRSKRAQEFGMDYDSLLRHNSRLIYAAASGFGPEGPDSDMPSFDLVGAARSGVMTGSGQPGQSAVVPLPGGYVDQSGGIMLAFAIVAALLARERLGIAQRVDASLLGAQLCLQYSTVAALLLTGKPYGRRGRLDTTNPLYNWYECRDGKYILLGMLTPDQYWSRFCKILGITSLEKDPKFINMPRRAENAPELITTLDKIFITRDCREWEDILQQADLPAGGIKNIEEVVDDPQAVANKYVIDYEHADLGKIRMPGFPLQFSKTPCSMRHPAPAFAQHNEEVLLELGYSWEEIARLRQEGIICA